MSRKTKKPLKKPSHGMLESIKYGERYKIAGTNYAGRVARYKIETDEKGNKFIVKVKGLPFVNLDKLDLPDEIKFPKQQKANT